MKFFPTCKQGAIPGPEEYAAWRRHQRGSGRRHRGRGEATSPGRTLGGAARDPGHQHGQDEGRTESFLP